MENPISMIVNGTDMLYMDDIEGNYIRDLEAIVVKKDVDEKGRPFIVLDRGIFYPEGGGQPTDTGVLEYLDPDTGEEKRITIVRVTKKETIRHYIASEEAADAIRSGLKVRGQLDWETRYAHMRMHTAQHLVSAVAYNTYQTLTVGNQIHSDQSRIDFSPLSQDQVDTGEIERQCNELISVDPPVKVFFEKRSTIEASEDAERCNVHLIPQSVRQLRIVKIQDVELCPCAGTHVRTLGEVGGVRIMSVRSKGKGKVRITYELL